MNAACEACEAGAVASADRRSCHVCSGDVPGSQPNSGGSDCDSQLNEGDEFGDNIEVGYGFDIEGVSIGAAYGDYDDAWTYWTIGVSGEIEGIGWDFSYWDTDLDDDPMGDGSLVFTISKSL